MIPERTTTFMYRWAPKEAEALIHECVKDRIMSMVHSGYKYTPNHGSNLEITITTRILGTPPSLKQLFNKIVRSL